MTNARLVLSLLGVLVSNCVQAQQAARPSSAAGGESFVGRWYVGSVKACVGKQGETVGLLVYTVTSYHGLEIRCDINKTAPYGAGVELESSCSSEGETYTEKEILVVVNGKLQRTVTIDGRAMTFSYNRCPSWDVLLLRRGTLVSTRH